MPKLIATTLWVSLTILLLQPLAAQPTETIPRPPSFYGGGPNLTLDLQNAQAGSIQKFTSLDYVKFNPRFRSLVPTRRKCSTLEMEEDRKAKHGGESLNDFENWMNRNVQATRSLRKRSVLNEVYTLPIVFHIIYSNPTENVSEEQIMSQLRVLNEDYRRTNMDAANTNASFKEIAVDTEIEFCLATIDPRGRPTSGIDRISISGAPFRDRYVNEVIKPNTIWDPDRYMNIWVCNLSGGILGFAQFPSSSGLSGIPTDPGGESTDGVVIHYNAFGTIGTASSPFNRGRTGTHEIGHWLGLRHIWGDGPCEADDFCRDTPTANDPHFNCPGNVSGCSGLAMVQNYMDYTDDACMNLFTRDQRTRMRTVLESSPRRRGLIRSDACRSLIEPPVADFSSDVRFGCSPLTVNFQDQSEGAPTQYRWSFPGGSPAVSFEANPLVTYSLAGTYRVSLTTSNAFGEGETQIRDGYIRVISEGAALPVTADFESEKGLPENFFVQASASEEGWKKTQRVSGKGASTAAYWFNNYDNNLVGSVDWMITPVMDWSKGTKTTLAFDIAYARFDGRYSDSLGVFISTDCQKQFQAIYFRGGSQLATSQDYNRPFSPFPEEWRKEYIDLSQFDGESHVQIAFVNFSGYGNNIYLDNIRIASKAKPFPVPDFKPLVQIICPGETITFENLSNTESEKFSWSFPGGIPGTDTSRNPRIVYPEAGTYDVVLTARNKSGAKTMEKKALITVKPAPDLRVNSQELNICIGSSRPLTASGAQAYLWSPAEGLDKTLGATVQASPQHDVTYQVSGTGTNGCISTKSITAHVRRSSSFTLTPSSAVVCNGQGVSLEASGAGHFHWAPATGLSDTSGATVTASPKTTTTYTVYGRNDGGCEFSKQITVKVVSAPKIYAKAEKRSICAGEEIRIRATGAESYRWSTKAGGESYEGEEIVVSPRKSITFTVSSGSAGCLTELDIAITVKPKPEITVPKDPVAVCAGKSGELRVSGASTFQWLPAEGLNITRGATIPVFPKASTEYKVVGANMEGCTDTATVEVIVPKPADVFVINSRPTICPGMSSKLTATGALNYQWAPNVGLNKNSGAIVMAQPLTSISYTLTATDQYGCVSRRQVKVGVAGDKRPSADFAVASPKGCVNQTIQIVDQSRFATAYFWEIKGATPSSSTEQSPKVKYTRPGIYDVTLKVVGCNGKDKIEKKGFITILPSSGVKVSDSLITLCKGDTAHLLASGADDYRWTPDIGLDGSSGREIFASPRRDMLYTVSALDENGCNSEATVRVLVRGDEQDVKIRSAHAKICAGESTKLIARGAEDYVWYTANKDFLGVGETLDISPATNTTYLLEARNSAGCASTKRFTMEVKPGPVIKAVASKASICRGDQLELSAQGGLTYEWSPSDGMDSTFGAKIIAKPIETITYRVSGTDGFGCSATDSVRITVNNGKSISIAALDSVICPGDTTTLTAKGGVNYQWLPAEGLKDSFGIVVAVFPQSTTTYTVMTRDSKGCAGFASATVKTSHPHPIVISPASAVLCKGDTISLEATGALSYRWDEMEGFASTTNSTLTVSPGQTSTYSIKGFDRQGCITEGAATIQVSEGGDLQLTATSASVCEGEEVALKVEGGENYEWFVNGVLNKDAEGTQFAMNLEQDTEFMVKAQNKGGCPDQSSLIVEVRSMQLDFTMSSDSIDLATQDGVITFIDQSKGVTSLEWDFGDGGNSEQSNPIHIFTREGIYPVTLIASNGICTEEIGDTVIITNTSDLEELTDESGIKVYPTPTLNGKVTLEITSNREMFLKYRLLSPDGKSVLTDVLALGIGMYQQSLDLSFFPKGIYTLQITDGGEMYSKQIDYRGSD